MSEDLAMEVNNDTVKIEWNKRKFPKELHGEGNDDMQFNCRRTNGVIRAKYKQSYAFLRYVGDLRLGLSLRSDHRRRLRVILYRLMRKHKWEEASGVLSVLLKGSRKESSLAKNETKYSATLQLLRNMTGGYISFRKVQHVFELWMKKIGFMNNWPIEERFVVQLEFIIYCLTHGNVGDAHQAVIGLTQERGFGSDPVSNFVVGLTFFQLWYRSIPEELQLRDVDESHDALIKTEFDMSIEKSVEHDSVAVQEASSSTQSGSNTSIRIDKQIYVKADINIKKEVFMEVDNIMNRETTNKNIHVQGFYSNSIEGSGQQESSFSTHSDSVINSSDVYTHGLPSWCLPLRLSHLNISVEDLVNICRELRNDYYKNAIKYFHLALDSSPLMLAALRPLIQMLLIGGQLKDALTELEKFAHDEDSLRLKAVLLEHFDGNNYAKLSACYEDIFTKDPTLTYPLERLVSMHQSGDYNTEKLVEMIALHLDSSQAESKIWRVFSSCLLNLSRSEEDRISVCLDNKEGGDKEIHSYHINKLPGIFNDNASKKMWMFRCEWWLTRYFSHSTLESDVASVGGWELLTYKAACACHLYGHDLEYVVKASACLDKENDNRTLSAFLRTHKRNSVGFYFCVKKVN